MNRRLITTSARFDLVKLLPSDETLFIWIYQDPSMMEHLGGPMSLGSAKARFRKWIEMWKTLEYGTCLIQFKETAEVVGIVALFPAEVEGESVFEIGWSVFHNFRGRGSRSKSPVHTRTMRSNSMERKSSPPSPVKATWRLIAFAKSWE